MSDTDKLKSAVRDAFDDVTAERAREAEEAERKKVLKEAEETIERLNVALASEKEKTEEMTKIGRAYV